MNKRNLHIEEEVRKTMEMADHIQKVEGNPYVITRILQQIEQEQRREVGFFSSLSPAYKMAFSIFIIALNVMVFLQLDNLDLQVVNNNQTIDVADEYGLVVEDSYELSYILEK